MSILPEHNDHHLLHQLTLGNESAFRTIFNMHVAPLQYFARQIIHNQWEAEDIVSLAFHKLWEKKGPFPNMKALRSFLYTTVRRQCIDLLRHQVTVENVHQQLSATTLTDENLIETKYLQTELLRLIYSELQTLPERYRIILEWSFIEELSTAEMAARLNLSEAHVRADRSRGLALLRAALKNRGLLLAAMAFYVLLRE